jgi:hypothetical protein
VSHSLLSVLSGSYLAKICWSLRMGGKRLCSNLIACHFVMKLNSKEEYRSQTGSVVVRSNKGWRNRCDTICWLQGPTATAWRWGPVADDGKTTVFQMASLRENMCWCAWLMRVNQREIGAAACPDLRRMEETVLED